MPRVALHEVGAFRVGPSDELLAVDEALAQLELDSRQVRIVELRYFGGLSVDETAEAPGNLSEDCHPGMERCKAWLYGDLKERTVDNTTTS